MTYGHHSWEDEGHVHHHVMMKRENHGGWAGQLCQPAGSVRQCPEKTRSDVRQFSKAINWKTQFYFLSFTRVHKGFDPPNAGASGALVS